MRKGVLFRTGCYGAIFCIAIILGLGITVGPLHAASVETSPGNWVVTTDPPHPSPPINTGGGNSIEVQSGATIAAVGWGIYTTTDFYTITNTGTINAGWDGIRGYFNNTITNNGTIDAGGYGIGGYYNNTITNTGTIDAGGYGIWSWDNNTITNNGTINAGEDGIGAHNDNTIFNFGTIDAGSDGIDANDNNTITNNGIVRGSTGINLYSGTITNMATIEGTGGIAIQGWDGVMTVNLESGSTLIGNIDDTSNVDLDQVNLNGSGTFSYQFTGIEELSKNNPGTWRLAHAAPGTFNAVTINAGTLQVDGVLNTTDYTQAPGAVLGIGVQGPATSGVVNVTNAPALNNGLLQPIPIGFVPAGATYDVMTTSGFTNYFGGVVSTPVLQYALTYPGNTIARLTVQRNSYVDALGGGTENQRRIAHYLQGLLGSGGDMGDVLFMLDGIPTLGGYRNALDQFSPEVYAGLRDIDLALLNRLNNAVQGRLGSLGGVAQTPTPLYAALFNTVSDAGPILASAPVFSEEGAEGMDTGIWGRGLGIFGDQDGDDEHFGFDYLTGGLILGADHRFTDRIVAGITAGFADTTVDYDTVISETEAMSYFGGLYGGYTAGQLHLNAQLSWVHSVYHTSRYITAVARRASSEHRANEVCASLEGGYTFTLGGFDLIPTASVQYAYYFADSFTEEGAGALNLRVDDFDSHSVVSRIGLRLSRVFDIGTARFVPQVRAAWAHEYGEIDRTMRARLAGGGGGGTFTVEGYEPGRDSALLGADISFTAPLRNDRYWGSLFFGYDAELREGLCAHNITGGIRITF
jgi:uncharacterized protein with beta-barrel porin domain